MNKPVLNVIDPRIESHTILLQGESKTGKTTMFRDIVMKKFGDPTCGLLIQCGSETGIRTLDQLYVIKVDTWDDVTEIVEAIINKEPGFENIKIVCIDTIDGLVPLAERKAVAISNAEDTKGKKVKSIKAAFGGYNSGPKYAVDHLILPMLSQLSEHVGVWVNGHTKVKDDKNKGTTSVESFDVLQSSLDSSYGNALQYWVDLLVTIDIEPQSEQEVITVNKNGEDKKVVRTYRTGDKRWFYFRSTPKVKAGGRLAAYCGIPERLQLEMTPDAAGVFIKTVEDAFANSTYENRMNCITKTKDLLSVNVVDEDTILDSDILDDDTDILDEMTVEKYLKKAPDTSVKTLKAELQKLFKTTKDKTLKAEVKNFMSDTEAEKTSESIAGYIVKLLNAQE